MHDFDKNSYRSTLSLCLFDIFSVIMPIWNVLRLPVAFMVFFTNTHNVHFHKQEVV